MRIALAPEGTRGDVFPLLDLAGALQRAGYDVVVCAPPGFAHETRDRGLEFRPVGTDVEDFLRQNAGSLVKGGTRLARSAHRWIGQVLECQVAELPAACEGADLVIGAGMQLLGASVAERLGVPYRYVVYCPVALPSAEHAPFPLAGMRLPPALFPLAWWAVRKVYRRFVGGQLDRVRCEWGLAPIGDVFEHLVSPRAVVAVDPELARVPDDCPVPTTQVRCLHAVDRTPLPDKLRDFIESGPPPVYLGFGSMTDPDPGATTRLFGEAVERLGLRALVSAGWAGFGSGPLSGNVMRVGPVSHAELFPHVRAVVHHGGAGTTTLAARAGVPQLVVPHAADQFYWGARVRELGLGAPPVPRARLTRARLERALGETLEHEVVRDRARELGQRLRDRLADEPPAERLIDAVFAGSGR